MTSRLRLVALLAVSVAAASGCIGQTRTTFPPIGSTPGPVGNATAATEQAVIGALAGVGLQAAETLRAFRPPEGALLAAAPRSVLQVALPDDPAHGFIVVYALADPATALAAATDMAGYIANPTGGINFPVDSRFVLRVVGSTVVFYSWSPGSSPDARTPSIEEALTKLGTEVQIPA
jgi:hypothetical protein